ncbi:MAG: carbon-nitrogen hydrolase family protein [Campylobacterales bacterium]|nr:carbon-nitrogen hydrolase family protein [Campylobacterales bacterium]
MISNKLHIISLQKDFLDFDKNLEYLKNVIIQHTKKETLILAPELYLSGFDYDNMSFAAKKSAQAIQDLLLAVEDTIVVLSVIAQEHDAFFNQAVVINKHQIIHKQNKTKLFKLGEEHKHFRAGSEDDIVLFEVNRVKFALLICFELRFKMLWKKIEGADIVLIPAKWGLLRAHHMEVLAKALAVMNQCYVVVSSAGNKGIINRSLIISPDADVSKENEDEYLYKLITLKEITKMRRYIDMGDGE